MRLSVKILVDMCADSDPAICPTLAANDGCDLNYKGVSVTEYCVRSCSRCCEFISSIQGSPCQNGGKCVSIPSIAYACLCPSNCFDANCLNCSSTTTSTIRLLKLSDL